MAFRIQGLPDELITEIVGPRAFAVGRTYQRAGRVLKLEVDPEGAWVAAAVRGSRKRPYEVLAEPEDDGSWSGECSCPVGYDCKHVAAVLLAARAVQVPQQAVAVPEWQGQLAELVRPAAVQAQVGQPLALQFEVVEERIRLRPVVRSHTGNWVRTGCSWRDLEYSYLSQHVPAHREALQALLVSAQAANRSRYAYGGPDKVFLDDLGLAAWHLLARVQAAGVELLVGKGDPVLVAQPVDVTLEVTRAQDGGLSLHPSINGAGGQAHAASFTVFGSPVVGLFSTDATSVEVLAGPGLHSESSRPALALAPLAGTLDERVESMLRAAATVAIPAEAEQDFLISYYPALRQIVTLTTRDASVTLPEVLPPRLALAVTSSPDLALELDWTYAYTHAEGQHARHVPLGPRAADDHGWRDEAAEQQLLASVDPAARPYLAAHRRLTGMHAVGFTEAVLPDLLESDAVEVTVVGELPDFRAAAEAPVIAMSASDSEERDWFDLAVNVTVEGQEVPFDQLFTALAMQQTHLVLPSGLYLRIDVPELATLRQLIEEARRLQDRPSKNLRVSLFQAGLWEELLELGLVESQSARWSSAVAGLLNLQEVPAPALPVEFEATLRPYQLDGYQWLAFLWRHGLGGVLADDMGLGKTVQTLAMVCHARESAELPGPFLVVAPTSVVGNWEREAARFAPGLKVVAVSETTAKRGTPLAEDLAGADLVITSYTLLRIDEETYLDLPWAGLVLDEAQYVKNHQAKTYQVARRLPAPFKLAVTGTPLENSLMDLWSMFSIVAPGLYPSPQRFSEDYRRPIERGEAPQMLDRLRRRIRPLMLRRTKEQVVSDLPPKQEQVLEVVLDPKHQKVYQTHLQRERTKVLGLLGDVDRNRFEILKSLTMLRQLSLAPALVDPAYAKVPASKVEVFVETLREVAAEGHRALVFSQFTGFLKIVRERLDAEGIAYCYLDGRTRKRAERVAEFKEGTAPVFLISLKAGGVGLNLTEADYVFVLDPWWNPAVEAQAVDRTHRIGQDKAVMVYRMVAVGTIEEKVMELKARKQGLFDRVLDDGALMSGPLSVEDIRGLFG